MCFFASTKIWTDACADAPTGRESRLGGRMTTRRHFGGALGLALLVLFSNALSAGQAPAAAPAAASAALTIGGDVAKPLTLTPADLKALPRTRVDIKEDDRTIGYEGVLVGEILKRAGAPLGGDLRGNAVASYVVASASDGYQVVFSLAELDPAFTANDIIVADTIDGKPLFAHQGPIRLVAPQRTRTGRPPR